jgi:hypothetical protein
MPLGALKILTYGGNKCEALGNTTRIATKQTCINFVGRLRMSRTVWFVWRWSEKGDPRPHIYF